MTAIVAILNKSAAALSADSAVSVGLQTKKKVYNGANKVFNLAIGSPIGIMIYNNAEYLRIPWEALVKLFRKWSSNSPQDTVVAYRDHFLKFLTSEGTRYFLGDEEDVTISEIIQGVFRTLHNGTISNLARRLSVSNMDELEKKLNLMVEADRLRLLGEAREEELSAILNRLRNMDYCPGFDANDMEAIRQKQEKKVRHRIGIQLAKIGLNRKDLQERLFEAIMLSSVKQNLAQSYSGLVFAGFGENEIFPAITALEIGGFINGKIRQSSVLDDRISAKNTAGIYPFAQTDIMHTFIQGIDPQVNKNIPILLESALAQFKEMVLKGIDFSSPSEQSMKENLEKAIPDVLKTLVTSLDRSRKHNHEDAMIRTISTLSKEDLTAMAESLIHTTSLHRRASFAEESVGGPVDVAVITKGDGFIWIKRKHYFDPALNLNYTKRV